jgi:hypothetical protein
MATHVCARRVSFAHECKGAPQSFGFLGPETRELYIMQSWKVPRRGAPQAGSESWISTDRMVGTAMPTGYYHMRVHRV